MEGNRCRRICISEWRMNGEDTTTVYARNHAVRPISESDVILLKESNSTDTSAAAYATVSFDGR